MNHTKECQKIAIQGLRSCYGKKGIYAGLHQFRGYWARDSMWASLGALELKDYNVVKENLQLFLDFEKEGRIPLRIGNRFLWQTFLGIKSKKLYAHYNEDKRGTFSSDSNTLFVMAFYNYYLKTKDAAFVKKNQNKLKKIINCLSKYAGSDMLIKEDYYSTWMDGLRKKGKTFYSNLLYYLAMKFYSKLYKIKNVKFLKNLEKNIKKTFWNGKYFIDWVGNNDKDYFDTFANLIAIYFNFANKKEKKLIFEFIQKNKIINQNGTIHKSYPGYSEKYISPFLKFIGLKGYCSTITYPWMSFFYFLCLKKEKTETTKSKKALENLCKRIISDCTIYECYNKKLKPYTTIFYRAEKPFAWGCSFAILMTS